MTAGDAAAYACWKQVAVLDEAHGVCVVQHSVTGEIRVRKLLTVYDPEVYRYLAEHHVPGMPDITEL